ncbi:hypothetical protein SAMN04490195_0344 [Pseudomonas moorei]|uniref:Uncharacterized protein n=1 Tax=Pseudomonas moorei TaxID=395599 RepID=A0A1H0Y1N0_9PSED|nr:hypothetical protein SAMN04490195_0344 [Pseudomonas moorei]
MDVNDYTFMLDERVAREAIASRLAPTGAAQMQKAPGS